MDALTLKEIDELIAKLEVIVAEAWFTKLGQDCLAALKQLRAEA